MGYSIFIIAKNEKLQKAMYDFLEKNMVGYRKMRNESDVQHFRLAMGLDDVSGISYHSPINDPLIIGFDYNCSGAERTHIYEVLEWMCKKIGNEENGYYYDGEFERSPGISIMERIDSEGQYLIDRYEERGEILSIEEARRKVSRMVLDLYTGESGQSPEAEDAEIKKTIDVIENDIKRLDALWTATEYSMTENEFDDGYGNGCAIWMAVAIVLTIIGVSILIYNHIS
jgi:hypothetical protein